MNSVCHNGRISGRVLPESMFRPGWFFRASIDNSFFHIEDVCTDATVTAAILVREDYSC